MEERERGREREKTVGIKNGARKRCAAGGEKNKGASEKRTEEKEN
jgi:hypothetical protein